MIAFLPFVVLLLGGNTYPFISIRTRLTHLSQWKSTLSGVFIINGVVLWVLYHSSNTEKIQL